MTSSSKTEDRFFKELIEDYYAEFMDFLGLNIKLKREIPIELTSLEIGTLFLDKAFETDDGRILIIEFQSTPFTEKDIRRFNAYAAQIFNKLGKEATVLVIYSHGIGKQHFYLINWNSLFKPYIRYLETIDGDEKLHMIHIKLLKNEEITKLDELTLQLIPFLNNKHRIEEVFGEVLAIAKRLGNKDVKRRLIFLSKKFIKGEEEVNKMQKLLTTDNVYLMNHGEYMRKVGMEEGIEFSSRNIARSLLESGFSVEMVMKHTKLSKEEIENL